MKHPLGLAFVAFVFAVGMPGAVLAAPGPVQAVNPNAPALPAPGAPHYTTNPEVCLKNGGDPGDCVKLNAGNAIAFYWSWNCAGKSCAIAGFHLKHAGGTGARTVIRQFGSDPSLVDSSGKPLLLENEPGGGWRGACYVVTAYRTPVQNLVNVGGGAVHPEGTPSGSAAESAPSPQIFVGMTSQDVTIPANLVRGYDRTYWVLYSNNKQQIQTLPAGTSLPLRIGMEFFAQQGFSQTNHFYRAAFAFDLSSVGGNSTFGGNFVYDIASGTDCTDAYQAPTGFDSATWVAPSGGTLPGKKTHSGSSTSVPIDALVQKWPHSKPLGLLLRETQNAEFIQSGVIPPAFTCFGLVTNPRLILHVGTTV